MPHCASCEVGDDGICLGDVDDVFSKTLVPMKDASDIDASMPRLPFTV